MPSAQPIPNRVEPERRGSEATFQALVAHIRDIVVSYGPDGILTFVSESARSLGYEPNFGLGRSIFDFIHPEDHAAVEAAFRLNLQGIPGDRTECRLRHRDGHYVWFEEYSEPLYLDGALIQVNGVLRDIQERKVAEESLREREAMYRALVDHSHDGIFIVGVDRFLFVNPRATSIVGYTLEELYALNPWTLVHPDERARVQDNAYRRVRGEEVPSRYNVRILHKNGSLIYAELSLSKIPFAGQWAILGTLRDITQRLESEAALRNSEERYRLLVENQGEGVGYVDEEERILFMNRAAEGILGRPRAELLGRCLSDFTDARDFEKIRGETLKRKAGITSTYEMGFLRPDGERRQVLVTVTPHRDDQGRSQGALGIFRDITSIKQAEAELRRLSTAIAQASDSILVTDTAGTVLYANPATERLLGLAQPRIQGRKVTDLTHGGNDGSPFDGRWGEVVAGHSFCARMHHRRTNGTTVQTDTTLSPVRGDDGAVQYVVLTSRDVTREAELEAQLRHSQRMEAIGVLAGGIAHDFNNLLMPILGFAELAQDLVREDQPKLTSYLEEIQGAGHRAADLVSQILLFGRQMDHDRQPVELHPMVKECLKLMRAALPATITIDAQLDEACGHVLVDPSQIHQVLMNLCTNGFHAMRESGGKLGVTLDRVTTTVPLQAIDGDLPPGAYIRLRVSDNGCGMSPEVCQQVFLPFFTTKKVGEGTGLGLSIVHGIVAGCDGGILVESEIGRGSTFTVYLPAAQKSAPPNVSHVEYPARGHEHILVVDDERPIGQMLCEALGLLGYRVSAFQDGQEALAAFLANPEGYDLVMTDFSMPDLTGPELGAALWRVRPGLPVLLMTGFSEELDETSARKQGFANLLKKPLPLSDLARALRQALDDVQAGSL